MAADAILLTNNTHHLSQIKLPLMTVKWTE